MGALLRDSDCSGSCNVGSHDLDVISRLGVCGATLPAVLSARALLETALLLELWWGPDLSRLDDGAVGALEQETAISVNGYGADRPHGSKAADHFRAGRVAVVSAAALNHERGFEAQHSAGRLLECADDNTAANDVGIGRRLDDGRTASVVWLNVKVNVVASVRHISSELCALSSSEAG